MADGRFLSKSIAYSEQLAGLSWVAEVMFYRCLPHLDVTGRMRGETKIVKAITAPLKDALTLEVIEAALDELEAAELIERYVVDGVYVLHFPGFHRHQRNLRPEREAPSKLPERREKLRSRPAKVRRPPTSTREGASESAEQVRSNSGVSPENSGLKVKGSEGQGEGKVSAPNGAGARETWLTPFDVAWQARCGGKLTYGQAAKVLRPLVIELSADVVLSRWRRYLDATEPQYCSVKRFAEVHGTYAEATIVQLTDEFGIERPHRRRQDGGWDVQRDGEWEPAPYLDGVEVQV